MKAYHIGERHGVQRFIDHLADDVVKKSNHPLLVKVSSRS